MVVDRSDWVLIGANIGMEYYDDDKYEEFDEFAEQDKFGEITYLIDGMSGKYFIVGVVLAVDKDNSGLNFDADNLSIEQIDELTEKVYYFIENKFDIEVAPSLIVKTHWT